MTAPSQQITTDVLTRELRLWPTRRKSVLNYVTVGKSDWSIRL